MCMCHFGMCVCVCVCGLSFCSTEPVCVYVCSFMVFPPIAQSFVCVHVLMVFHSVAQRTSPATKAEPQK